MLIETITSSNTSQIIFFSALCLIKTPLQLWQGSKEFIVHVQEGMITSARSYDNLQGHQLPLVSDQQLPLHAYIASKKLPLHHNFPGDRRQQSARHHHLLVIVVFSPSSLSKHAIKSIISAETMEHA